MPRPLDVMHIYRSIWGVKLSFAWWVVPHNTGGVPVTSVEGYIAKIVAARAEARNHPMRKERRLLLDRPFP